MPVKQVAFTNRAFFQSIVSLLLLILVYMSGCSTSKRPAINPTESRVLVVQEILQQNSQKLATLQGRGKLVVQSPRQSFSGSAIVNVKTPDSIYVRIEAILGLDVGLVFADPQRFLIYSPMENLAYVGGAGDTLLLKPLLGFDLTFQDMMQSLTGLATLKDMAAAKMKTKENELHIIGFVDSIFYDYTIDTQFGLISKVEMKDFQGDILRTEEYKRFKKIKNIRIPQMVRFIRPREKESLTIFYDQLSINQSIPKKKFHINVPEDVLKIRL